MYILCKSFLRSAFTFPACTYSSFVIRLAADSTKDTSEHSSIPYWYKSSPTVVPQRKPQRISLSMKVLYRHTWLLLFVFICLLRPALTVQDQAAAQATLGTVILTGLLLNPIGKHSETTCCCSICAQACFYLIYVLQNNALQYNALMIS